MANNLKDENGTRKPDYIQAFGFEQERNSYPPTPAHGNIMHPNLSS